MRTLPKTFPRCKCGTISPLRAARVDVLLHHLGEGTTTVSWWLYNELHARYDWPRGVADQALNDAAIMGKVRFSHEDYGMVVEVLGEENSCPAA